MYRTVILARLVVALFCCALWSGASAQVRSCSRFQAVGGSSGYQFRSGDSRCEGFYQSPVAGESLELLSLTMGRIDYRVRSEGTVHIVAPEVGALNSAEVQIQARALPLGAYYLMESSIASAGLMKWPMAPILAPAKLTPDAIGVTAWVEKGDHKVFVPVLVSESLPTTKQTGGPLVLILRASIDLDALLWRSLRNDSFENIPEWKTRGDGHSLRAGQPIELELEPGKGIRTLEVKVKARNSDRWLGFKKQVFEP